MKQYIKNYKKKLKTKLVVFYLHEGDLYNYASKINFNGFVKAKLKEEMKKETKK